MGLLPGGAQHLGHPLQQLPADHAVLFHYRAEVPVGKPITDEFGGGGNRRHARAFVDQSDLAEIVAMLQGRAFLAVDEDRRLTGFDHEEGSAARALLDDSFPSRKTALLKESRNLLDLMLGQIREQGHTLQDLNGRASYHRPSQASPAARQ